MQKFWRNLVFWYFERYHFRQGIRGTFEVGGDGALAGLAVPPAPPPELLPGHDGGAGWPGAGEGWAGPEQDAGPAGSATWGWFGLAKLGKLAKCCKFLAGSFSAVSKRNFARKYAFDSICQALKDLHTFATLHSQNFRKKLV